MVLITGATGFIGKILTEKFSKQNIKIRCLVRNRNDNLFKNIETIKGDLLDSNSLNIATKDVETVIHLAGVRDAKKIIDYKSNTEGTRNLIDSCKRNQVKKIIFISSLNVTLPNLNNYARSKLESEKNVINSGLKWVILRPSLVYGRNDRSIINTYLNLIRKLPVIPVIGNGNQKIQPIFVDDFIEIIEKVYINAEKYYHKIYTIVGPEVVSYNQLINIISNIFQKRIIKIKIPFWLVKTLSLLFPGFKDKLIAYMSDKVGDFGIVEKNFNIRAQPLYIRLKDIVNKF